MADHPNVELVRRIAEARLRLDEDVLANALADDLSFGNVLGAEGGPDVHGRDAVIEMWKAVAEGGNAVSYEIEAILANDERAVVLADLTMRRADGRSLTTPSIWVCRCANGRVTEMVFYYGDPAAVLSFWS